VGEARRPSAEAVEAYEVPLRLHTGPECSREPVRVFPPSDERIFSMIPGTESSPSDDTAESRQKKLTLGVVPVRRSKASNLKWNTWKKRLEMRADASPQ
jgi:hypothetical protein